MYIIIICLCSVYVCKYMYVLCGTQLANGYIVGSKHSLSFEVTNTINIVNNKEAEQKLFA